MDNVTLFFITLGVIYVIAYSIETWKEIKKLEPPKFIPFECNCGNVSEIDRKLAGTKFACPHC